MLDHTTFTQLDEVAPGPWLAAMLAAGQPSRTAAGPQPDLPTLGLAGLGLPGPTSPGAGLAGVVVLPAGHADPVSVMTAWQRLGCWVDAGLNQAILAVAGKTARHEPDEDWGREEVSAALHLPPATTADRINLARQLAWPLTATATALAEGRITLRHATEIARALQPLADDVAVRAEAAILAKAPGRTAAQLARIARREAIAHDPHGADQRHKTARAQRRVEFTPLPDGMAELRAFLPADHAAHLRAAIDQLAGRIRTTGDSRTIDQRRADALLTLAQSHITGLASLHHAPATPANPDSPHHSPARNSQAGNDHENTRHTTNRPDDGPPTKGRPDGGPLPDKTAGTQSKGNRAHRNRAQSTQSEGDQTESGPQHRQTAPPNATPASRQAAPLRVAVIAPLTTLTGHTNLPGELIGYGPIPPALVRELAGAEGARWQKWITDPGGTVTNLGRRTYRPPAGLAALIRAANPTCVFPTCSQPAHRCDLDHLTRWTDGGDTKLTNLAPLCRRHHRAKDHAGWHLHRATDGSAFHWTSPAGHHYTVPAHTYDTGADPIDDAEAQAAAEWDQPLTYQDTPQANPNQARAPMNNCKTVKTEYPTDTDRKEEPAPF